MLLDNGGFVRPAGIEDMLFDQVSLIVVPSESDLFSPLWVNITKAEPLYSWANEVVTGFESLLRDLSGDVGEIGLKDVFWFSWVVGNIEGMFMDVDFESGVTACLETVSCKENKKENGWMRDAHFTFLQKKDLNS